MIDQSLVLSKREWDALGFAAEGLQYFQIADEMGLRVQTVKNHLHSAYTKLGAGCLIEALNIVGWVHVPTARIVSDTWTAA